MPLFSLTPFSTGGSWQGMRCIICSWVRLAGEAWRDADQDFFISSLGQFKKEYPEAKVIGVEALVEKKRAEGLILDGGGYLFLFVLSERFYSWATAYGANAPDTKYGFEDEVRTLKLQLL
jgi:hypothetical protein